MGSGDQHLPPPAVPHPVELSANARNGNHKHMETTQKRGHDGPDRMIVMAHETVVDRDDPPPLVSALPPPLLSPLKIGDFTWPTELRT